MSGERSIAAAAPTPRRSDFLAWYTLAILATVTLFAFIDRQVLQLLAEQIKRSLSLSDFQLGLLQGTGVAIFSAIAAYPLSWLSDRYDRRIVLVGSILVWSIAVVACGLARSFGAMFVATSMVAAGEAGLAPLTYAVIPELFEPRRRQLANSIFALVSSATGSLALAAGGQMIAAVEGARASLPASFATLEPWRLSFFAAAAPAPIMMLIVFTTALNRRVRAMVKTPGGLAQPVGEGVTLAAFLRENLSLLLRLFGSFGIANFAYSAFLTWMVVICLRTYGQTAAQVGASLGFTVLAATPVGFGASLLVNRFLLPRAGPAMIVRLIWVGNLITAAALASLATVPPLPLFYAAVFLGYAINMTVSMILPTALQGMTPEPLRARIFSINLIGNVVFVLWAAPVVGLVSDRFWHGPYGLLWSAISITTPALILSSVLLRSAEGGFARLMASRA